MTKDRKARAQGRVTVVALANLIAALAHTMRTAEVPPAVTHEFLDRLEDLNQLTLHGMPLTVLADVVDIVRRTVPTND